MKHDSPASAQFKYHLFHSKTLVGSKLAEGMEFKSYSLTGIDSNIMASAKRFYRTESDCRSKIHKLMLSLRFFFKQRNSPPGYLLVYLTQLAKIAT